MYDGHGSPLASSALPAQQSSLFSLLSHPAGEPGPSSLSPGRALGGDARAPPSHVPRPSSNPSGSHPSPQRSADSVEIDLTADDDDDDGGAMNVRDVKRAKASHPGGGGGAQAHLDGRPNLPPSSFPPPPSGWQPPQQQHHPHHQPSLGGWNHPPQLSIPSSSSSHPAFGSPSGLTSPYSASTFPPISQPNIRGAAPSSASLLGSPSASSSMYTPHGTNGHAASSLSLDAHRPPLVPSHPHPPPSPSGSSSSSSRQRRQPSPIDVDDYPSPPARVPSPPRPPRPPPPQPTLLGYLQTTALILYPSPYLELSITPTNPPKESYPKGEVLVVEGNEWGRVKLKHKPQPKGGPTEGSETINILPFGGVSGAVEPFGVVASGAADVLGLFLNKGLIRVEGWILRGGAQNKFCQILHLFLVTIPPNIAYVSNALAEKQLYLEHPRLPWRAEWFQNCVYSNPHIDANVANVSGGRKNIGGGLRPGVGGGLSVSAAAKIVEQQRSQVDEVFQSLKASDALEETHPGPWIGAELYPHQKKALTFLRDRENEKLPPMGVRKKDFHPTTPGSLWVPMSEQTGRKGKSSKPSSWEHRVTKETVRTKPKECRGAILADDMGLGKSLSIVSLVASTIGTARKFEIKPLKEVHAPSKSKSSSTSTSTSDHEDEPESSSSAVDASHFQGAVFGMPDMTAKTARQQQSDAKRKADRAIEAHARRSRIKVRSRATLIVCPLTTVSNWEDQFMEHWAGPVTVCAGGQGKEGVQMKKNGRTKLSVPKLEPDSSDESDSDGSSSSDDDDSHVLRVYVYHGNARNLDCEYLADFDVVITTFSTLATEFSKQSRTAEGANTSGTSTPSNGRTNDDDDSDGVTEVDANGAAIPSEIDIEAKELEKATNKKRKRGKGAVTNLGVPNETEITSPLQQIEWFRVVLDEAHFIKDANTVASRASCYLEAQRRICLTGTPIQNKLDDLWALIKFIRLEPFDDKSVWSEYVSAPAKYGDSIGVARLQVIMRHITLRRTKETKLASGKTLLDLPPRKDEIVYLEFDEKEKAIYDKHHVQSKADFQNMVSEGVDGKISNSNYVNILQSILRLRQICDHYLLLNDKSAPDDDLDSGELLDYEDAVAAINVHGINQRRAAAVMVFFKEEDMCVCSECDLDLSCLAAGPTPDADDGAAKPAVKKGRGKKKVPQAVLTKCQHLYCLACFKSSIYAAWPKAIGGVGRSCSKCASGLRLATDCVEIIPPGSSEAVSSSDFAARAKSAKKKQPRSRREDTGELVYSTKIRHLIKDLLAYSALNPHSANFGGNLPSAQAGGPIFTGGDGAQEAKIEELAVSEPAAEQPLPPTTSDHEMDDIKPRVDEVGSGVGDMEREMDDVKPSLNGAESPSASAAAMSADDAFDGASKPALPVDPMSEFADLTGAGEAVEEVDPFVDLEEPYASDVRSGKPIKTIVFSQWTSMLDRIEDALADTGIKYDRLDGTMKRDDRTRAMERLKKDPTCEVLLVSLRAGGVGLNLTVANRVYLIDPFWNPAVENQAVDRIHRLGQVRPVIATKYIMAGSMEEKMLAIQRKKEQLASMSLSQTMSKKELHEQRMEDLSTLFS